jgi:hypothetical protein
MTVLAAMRSLACTPICQCTAFIELGICLLQCCLADTANRAVRGALPLVIVLCTPACNCIVLPLVIALYS